MVFSFAVSPGVSPPARRAAPPARPHSFAGFRAQHHHYHQQLLRNSQQAAPCSRARLSKLPDGVLCRVFLFLSPDESVKLERVSRRFRLLSQDPTIWDLKLRWLDYKGPLPSSAHFHNSMAISDDETFGEFVVGPTRTRVAPPLTHRSYPKSNISSHSHMGHQVIHTSQVAPGVGTGSGTSSLSFTNQDLLMVFDAEDDVGSSTLDRIHVHKPPLARLPSHPQPLTARQRFIQRYTFLLPYIRSLCQHTTSSLLFTDHNLTSRDRADLFATLSRLISNPFLAPTRFFRDPTLARNIQSAIDVFEASLLSEFERADERGDEMAMRSAAELVWALGCDGSSVVQVFATKREIFYDTRFNPLDCLVRTETSNGQMADGVDFRPLETYIRHVLETISKEGSLIARVFPPDAAVLLCFVERIAVDVLSEYITTLLSSAQSLPQPLFQLTNVTVYSQLRAAIETTVAIEPRNQKVNTTSVEEIFNKMFEIHLTDYLQEEAEWTKDVLERICAEWGPPSGIEPTADAATLKRNVLGSLRDALLIPVSVVPKTVAYSFNALSSVGAGALQSVTGGLIIPVLPGALSSPATAGDYKDAQFLGDGCLRGNELQSWLEDEDDNEPEAGRRSTSAPITTLPPDQTMRSILNEPEVNDLRLLLSLDVSLKLIATDREALKRVESFQSFTGFYGRKVRDTLEEVFIQLLQTLSQKHIKPAFARATAQMSYHHLPHLAHTEKKEKKVAKKNKPGEVAALVEYFELVQLADTIQQMVEAYYEAEMAQKIDRTDFLNAVVREKRAFETGLDDGVASGLNASVGLLMSEVERVMSEAQSAIDYCPHAGTETIDDARGASSVARELAPTAACQAAIDCLDRHCGLLQGSGRADKQMIEVFYQEVGLRLHGLICKHLKRAIVSVEGGFQLIADLNAYHQYVSNSFRSPELSAEFTSLKLLGSLFIIESPKLLTELARDVQRFGGTFRAEDIYEFIKRRSDWKKIEKEVDRAMFGMGQDDCVIS